MTRDEHRNACLKAMEAAIINCRDKWAREHRWFLIGKPCPINLQATAAFDALPMAGARVVPVDADGWMVEAGRISNLELNPMCGLYERVWRGMAAAGDLTNPPETKGLI